MLSVDVKRALQVLYELQKYQRVSCSEFIGYMKEEFGYSEKVMIHLIARLSCHKILNYNTNNHFVMMNCDLNILSLYDLVRIMGIRVIFCDDLTAERHYPGLPPDERLRSVSVQDCLNTDLFVRKGESDYQMPILSDEPYSVQYEESKTRKQRFYTMLKNGLDKRNQEIEQSNKCMALLLQAIPDLVGSPSN